MSRRDQRPTYTPPVPDDELSLEAILAEYGRGGRQPAPDTAPAAEPAPAAPSVPESVPDPEPAPAAEPEPVPEPKPTVEPESVPEPEDTPLSDVPDRVSLKDVMNQTVESVLEESEDGVLDEPVPLGQRLAALLHRFTERGDDRRRGLSQETEQLFDEPEDEPEPEEPVYEPFATIELPAQDPVPAEIPYDGVTLYGFPAVRTEIVRSGEADLDTDGAMETVQLLRIWDQYDQQSFILRIQKGTEVFDTGMDEGELSYPPSFNARIWLADLDADACPEIYFCGDMSSDDYVLNAWSCKSGTPELIPFEDQLFLEASILSISEGSLQLESTQDVLGSYEAVRAYVLHDGVLVPLGDAWQIVPANTSYSRLSVVRDIPVTLDDGTESVFGTGTVLQVTGTDGKSFVDVITEDGVTGRIAITQPAGDWQWYINGEPELEYFELVPYAG